MKPLLSRSSIAVLLTLALAGCLLGQAAPNSKGQPRVTNGRSAVQVREEPVAIPTYLIGPPDPNPQFYFGGASQGAQHRIYPYPMYDNLTTEKVDKSYKMVYLENEYLRVGLLPESGGKIFEAIDKTNGYNFFYRQHVIKPALISLLGAWISGGVEWDVPHHHRATSFLPVQYTIEESLDGSKTGRRSEPLPFSLFPPFSTLPTLFTLNTSVLGAPRAQPCPRGTGNLFYPWIPRLGYWAACSARAVVDPFRFDAHALESVDRRDTAGASRFSHRRDRLSRSELGTQGENRER